tara:strand:+ start:71 stop:1381 length:1311 start_codon:yes stop_codon:yes gene_type:complete
MINSIKSCFYNYANFSGTASRSEFWWFCLFSLLIFVPLGIIFGESSAVSIYANALFALPTLSVASRRLHDINKSGWWNLLWILIFIGWIPLIIWYCRKSKEPFDEGEVKNKEKLIPFLNLAKEGVNNWKAWTLGSIIIIIFWQFIGQVPFIFSEEVSIKDDEFRLIFDYVISNWMFVIGLFGIFIASRLIHKKHLIKFITSRSNIDYDKILLAILIGFLFISYEIFVLDPNAFDNIKFNSPSISVFLVLVIFAIVLTPIQCAFEEVLFRGYILQGLSLKIKSIFLLCITNGILFMLPHLLNPEPWEYGLSFYVTYMVLTGAFFSLIVIKDNGSEISIGLHAINNLFIALIISTEVSVMQTPSLFVFKEVSFDYKLGDIIYMILSLGLSYTIFSTKYGWDKNIFDRFKKNPLHTQSKEKSVWEIAADSANKTKENKK